MFSELCDQCRDGIAALARSLEEPLPLVGGSICLHYNKGHGPYGSCSFRKQCVKLHICQYFSQGECKFGTGCKRSHDFSNSENLEKLEKLGMRSELVSRLPSIYRNAHDIKNKSSPSIRVPPPPSWSQGTSGKALGWGSWMPADR
eukprot:bmy_04330T0